MIKPNNEDKDKKSTTKKKSQEAKRKPKNEGETKRI
jgi:hypothetical protein